MDTLDKKIIAVLEKNVRLHSEKIATQVGKSSPTVKRRIDRLRKEGLLQLGPILDIRAAGYEYLLIIEVKVEDLPPEAVANNIAELEETLNVNLVVGACDIVIVAVAKSREALNTLIIEKLATIDGVANIKSTMALQVWKFQREKVDRNHKELLVPKPQLDGVDIQIADLLRIDVRTSNNAIANSLSLSESAVRSRIKKMLECKQLSFSMPYSAPTNLTNDAIVGLEVRGGMASAVCDALSEISDVSFACTALGQYTVICCIHISELEELTQILYQQVNTIPGVKSIHALHCIKRVKHQSFLGIVP